MNLNQVLNSYYADVVIPDYTDVNNDGIDDEIGNGWFSLGKDDSTFYYVPQYISGRLADMNGDGLLDTVSVSGQFVTVRHQDETPAPTGTTDQPPIDPAPTDPAPTDPTPTEPAPVDTQSYTEEEVLYAATLDAEFPGMTLIKISIEDDGSADFKIDYEGETIEGFMSGPDEISEISN